MAPVKVFFACFLFFVSGFCSVENRPAFVFCCDCFSPELVYFAPVAANARVDLDRLKTMAGQACTWHTASCEICGNPFYGPFGPSLNLLNSRIIVGGWAARNLNVLGWRWLLNRRGR